MRKLIASLKIHTTITLCRNIYKTTFLMKNIQIIIFSLSSINNFLILEQFFVMNMTKMMIHCKFKKVIIDKKSTRLTTIHFKITISFAMKKMNKNFKNLKDLFACPRFCFQVMIQNMGGNFGKIPKLCDQLFVLKFQNTIQVQKCRLQTNCT